MMNARQIEFYNKAKALAESIGWQIVSTNYVNSKTKMSFLCDKNHQIEKTWDDIKKCMICNKCPTKRSNECKARFFEELKIRKFTLVEGEEYKSMITKVKVLCPIYHPITITPGGFHSGDGCKVCSGKCTETAEKDFLILASIEGYTILDKYIRSDTPLAAICPKEHNIYLRPNAFKLGYRCIKCAGLCPVQAKERFMAKLKSEGYTFAGEYKGTVIHVSLICPNYHPWDAIPNNFMNGNRCPNCPRSESKGEYAIRLVFEKYGLQYMSQKIFNFLPTRKFDFYFWYKDEQYIIEFDGIQHFQYTEHFHGDLETFDEKQCIDISKTYTSMHHNIKMIRISYKEINEIEYHILYALQLNLPLYLSNPELYRYISECGI